MLRRITKRSSRVEFFGRRLVKSNGHVMSYGGSAISMASEKSSKGGKKESDNKYSATLNLPSTGFDLRANSAVREPQIQQVIV
jgi:hypothetical protein